MKTYLIVAILLASTSLVTGCARPPEFTLSESTGQAPLTVHFTNLSEHAEAYRWNFGDGTESTEQAPSHIYTKAGTYTVTLTAIEQAEPLETSEVTQIVTVEPGPLSRLVLDTMQVTLTPREDHAFSAEALDQFDNPISGLSFTFRSLKQAGQVDSQGIFTAGTKAGIYTDAVMVEATQDTITKNASSKVTVKPGPLDHVTVSPSNAKVFVGQQHPFQTRSYDSFGNDIEGIEVAWEADAAGSIDAHGLFTAGSVSARYPDVIKATAIEDHHQAVGTASIDIPLSGFGTATMDGVVNPAEWSGAALRTIDMIGPNSTPVFTVTLRVMNDKTNLYLGITINDDEFSTTAKWLPRGDSFRIDFDNDHDGVMFEHGEDALIVSAGSPQFRDMFLSPANNSTKRLSSDGEGGGSEDGVAVASRSERLNHFEIQHPLSSGDSRDFSLQPGSMVGFRLEYNDAQADGSVGGTFSYPGFRTKNVADIVIAAP